MKYFYILLLFFCLSCTQKQADEFNHIMHGNRICGQVLEKTIILQGRSTSDLFMTCIDDQGNKHIVEITSSRTFASISIGETWCFYEQ